MTCEAQELKNKYEDDLAELQGRCLHEETEWMKSGFAPGHYYGQERICLNCWKSLERDFPNESVKLNGEDFKFSPVWAGK